MIWLKPYRSRKLTTNPEDLIHNTFLFALGAECREAFSLNQLFYQVPKDLGSLDDLT
jgi:hypothetical protein